MKKYLVEAVGTMLLVLVIAMSAHPLAIGLFLTAIVYMGGYISGGHYNPAVTLAAWKAGKLDSGSAQRYWLFQVLGAIVGTILYGFISRKAFFPGTPPDPNLFSIFATELIFTFALASTVLHTAAAVKTKGNPYYGVAIGFVLFAGILAGEKFSGAVYNPAVYLGASVVNSGSVNIVSMLIYVAAQALGGLLAALFFRSVSE